MSNLSEPDGPAGPADSARPPVAAHPQTAHRPTMSGGSLVLAMLGFAVLLVESSFFALVSAFFAVNENHALVVSSIGVALGSIVVGFVVAVVGMVRARSGKAGWPWVGAGVALLGFVIAVGIASSGTPQ